MTLDGTVRERGMSDSGACTPSGGLGAVSSAWRYVPRASSEGFLTRFGRSR